MYPMRAAGSTTLSWRAEVIPTFLQKYRRQQDGDVNTSKRTTTIEASSAPDSVQVSYHCRSSSSGAAKTKRIDNNEFERKAFATRHI